MTADIRCAMRDDRFAGDDTLSAIRGRPALHRDSCFADVVRRVANRDSRVDAFDRFRAGCDSRCIEFDNR